jgi:hypothetical protein
VVWTLSLGRQFRRERAQLAQEKVDASRELMDAAQERAARCAEGIADAYSTLALQAAVEGDVSLYEGSATYWRDVAADYRAGRRPLAERSSQASRASVSPPLPSRIAERPGQGGSG